jgi:hypothetical protein
MSISNAIRLQSCTPQACCAVHISATSIPPSAARCGGYMWTYRPPLIDALAGRLTDRGRIVLIGSRTSTGAAGKSQYAASKAALDGLSRSWAIEIADLVGFLLGPSGRSITGQRIVVCAAASL